MPYQVIARKYRPQRFEDVVGQEHVTTTLMNAIRAGRIAHGYIFCGPRGTGKTTLARIFAKALNCTDGPKADFDLADPRVQEITDGRSLDVLEIDGASNNGVEQVRELRDTARFAPASGRFKIYIIDEVHMLSTAAFNALLKTLEEPPAHVKFLFATTDPEKVLVTILSRCQRFDLRRIPSALIAKHLAWIAGQEGVTLDDAALFAIARGADGGMRDAESTLDQLISFCGNHIDETDVLSMFGLAARRQLLDLSNAILASQSDQALRLVDELARSGKDLGRLLGDLLNHFRNLLVFQISRGDRSLIEATEAEFGLMSAQAGEVTTEALTRVLESLSQSEGALRTAPSKRIFLEVALLQAIQARSALSLDAVLRQLQALKTSEPPGAPTLPSSAATVPPLRAPPAPPASALPSPETTVPGSTAATVPAPTPVHRSTSTPLPGLTQSVSEPVQKSAANPQVAERTPPISVEAKSTVVEVPIPPAGVPPPVPVSMPGAAAVWNTLLQSLSGEPFLQVRLGPGRPQSLAGGILTVEFPEADYELLNTPATRSQLQEGLRQAGFPGTEVQLIGSRTPPPPVDLAKAAPTPTQRTPSVRPSEGKPAKVQPIRLNKDEFLNDPAIQLAIEVFRAQLIEVRAPGEPASPVTPLI